jgi:signal transduction histidine kinase
MYSEALQNEEGNTEEFQLEATNVIIDEVERLSRLINNLLSMNQIEMGTLQLDRQRIKLVDLIKDISETMERSARGRELKFELDLPNDVIPVHVDKDMLRIAINNLLTNAIKYSDPGGTITVSVYESAEAVTICVADTGIGISSDDQAQIFHKFYRVTGESMEDRSGHGLGLPLARDIVEMHHGSMRVESELGEGSRFYIDLWKHAGVVQQAI